MARPIWRALRLRIRPHAARRCGLPCKSRNHPHYRGQLFRSSSVSLRTMTSSLQFATKVTVSWLSGPRHGRRATGRDTGRNSVPHLKGQVPPLEDRSAINEGCRQRFWSPGLPLYWPSPPPIRNSSNMRKSAGSSSIHVSFKRLNGTTPTGIDRNNDNRCALVSFPNPMAARNPIQN